LKLRISDRAEFDLDEIYGFIAIDSVKQAQIFIRELRASLRLLLNYPRSGKQVADQDDPNVREIFFRHFRIAYLVSKDAIEIAAIQHLARQRDSATTDRISDED